MRGLPPALRRAQILERIQRDGGTSVTGLAEDMGVSAITVHRDLDRLAGEGLVERVYGGVIAVSAPSAAALPPTGWEQRAAEARTPKRAIANHAARLVRPGSTIFLDSSSSCLALARRLVEEPLAEVTLVTNSPAISYELVDDRILVIATPGELDQHMRLLAGRWTTEFLAGLNFDIAFCSCAGLTLEAGLTTSRRSLADVVNTARASARRSYALVDSSKFGRSSLLRIAAPEDFDGIITDAGLDASRREALTRAGVKLEVAA